MYCVPVTHLVRRLALAASLLFLPASIALAQPAAAQGGRGGGGRGAGDQIGSIDERTAAFKKIDGFFPLYWDEGGGRLWMQIPKLNTEVLYSTGIAAGLGSNDIGLDRGALADQCLDVAVDRPQRDAKLVSQRLPAHRLTMAAQDLNELEQALRARQNPWTMPS